MEIVKNKRYTKQEIRRNRFYQLPQFIFTEDKYKYKLSHVAKLVYILLRNRHDLSLANGWENKDGEVYFVYTRESLAKDLGISVPTASKAMEQLRELNLLEEQKRFNQPNLIYMTFVDIDTYIPEHLKQEENMNKENVEEDVESSFKSRDKDSLSQEEEKQTAEDSYSSHTENSFKYIDKNSLSPELKNFKPNQTDLNKTNYNKTDYQSYQSIDNTIENKNDIKILLKEVLGELLKEVKNENNNSTEQKDFSKTYTENQNEDTFQNIKEEEPASESSQENVQGNTGTNNSNKNSQKKNKKRKAGQQKKNVSEAQLEEYNEYREIISQNIEYETIKDDDGMIPDLLEIMVDTVATKRPTIRISGVDRPAEVVKSTLLKLNCEHIQYVVECLKKCKTDIRCIRAYMLTSLYNAYSTMDTYYTNRVTHDMYSDSSCA